MQDSKECAICGEKLAQKVLRCSKGHSLFISPRGKFNLPFEKAELQSNTQFQAGENSNNLLSKNKEERAISKNQEQKEKVSKLLREVSIVYNEDEFNSIVSEIVAKFWKDSSCLTTEDVKKYAMDIIKERQNRKIADILRNHINLTEDEIENIIQIIRAERPYIDDLAITPGRVVPVGKRIIAKQREEEIYREASIDIVKIIGQGFSKRERNVNAEDIIQLLGDALNLLVYNNVESPRNWQSNDNRKTYYNNSDFWRDALYRHLVEGMKIELINFHIMQWLPSAPGRYYTQEAERSRQKAQRYIIEQGRGREYLPLGKELMFLGGIGSVRLGARTFDSTTTYLLGASSTGSSHQGIPIMVPEEEYSEIVSYLSCGGCLANLQGVLRIFPIRDSLIQYDRQIPRYAIFIDRAEILQRSNNLIVTVGVTFSLDSSERKTEKSWAFCSFDPTRDDVCSAATWLEEYALRHSGQEILSDFDEHQQHFRNYSIEFPVSQVARGNINFDRLNEYREAYHFYLNEGAIMVQQGDHYQNYGQVGAMGSNPRSDDNSFTQLEEQNLAKAAAEIQQLLNQLAQKPISNEERTEAVHRQIKNNPSLKARLANALKSGGLEALKAMFNHPLFSIPAETVKGWLEAE